MRPWVSAAGAAGPRTARASAPARPAVPVPACRIRPARSRSRAGAVRDSFSGALRSLLPQPGKVLARHAGGIAAGAGLRRYPHEPRQHAQQSPDRRARGEPMNAPRSYDAVFLTALVPARAGLLLRVEPHAGEIAGNVPDPRVPRKALPQVRVHRQVEAGVQAADSLVERTAPEHGRLRNVIVVVQEHEAIEAHFLFRADEPPLGIDPHRVAIGGHDAGI